MLAAYDLDQPLLAAVLRLSAGRPARRLRAVVQVPATSPSPSCCGPGFPASLKVGGLAIVLAVRARASRSARSRRCARTAGVDYAVMATAMTGITIPNFVMAPLLTLIFGVYLGWLPVAGWDGGAPRDPDPAGDRARPAADRLHRAPDPRQHDRGAARQLRAHRARQGPARAHRGGPPRAAGRAAAGGLLSRPGDRAGAHRLGGDRDHLRHSRASAATSSRAR